MNTIVICIINHSYGSYVHELSYKSASTPMKSPSFLVQSPFSYGFPMVFHVAPIEWSHKAIECWNNPRWFLGQQPPGRVVPIMASSVAALQDCRGCDRAWFTAHPKWFNRLIHVNILICAYIYIYISSYRQFIVIIYTSEYLYVYNYVYTYINIMYPSDI